MEQTSIPQDNYIRYSTTLKETERQNKNNITTVLYYSMAINFLLISKYTSRYFKTKKSINFEDFKSNKSSFVSTIYQIYNSGIYLVGGVTFVTAYCDSTDALFTI